MFKLRGGIILFAVVFMVSAVVYLASDAIAPHFVSQNGCGPIRVDVNSINLSAGSRWLKRSYPVDDGGEPVQELYMNAVSSHLIQKILASNLASRDKGKAPFKLRITFVQSESGLKAGSNFDEFGSKARLISPWVRITTNAWRPCEMQAVFFRQGRQIARDQMEMLAGKALAWPNEGELSDAQLSALSREYARKLLWHGVSENRSKAISELRKNLPPDVLFAFLNSPQTTIHMPSLGFSIFMHGDQSGYAENTKEVLNRFFDKGRKSLIVKSAMENKATSYTNRSLNRLF